MSDTLTALLFGLAASSALVIGGAIGSFVDPPRRLVAVALAFASGALITAVSFDLFEESFKQGGTLVAGLGLLAGAAAFVVADSLLDHYVEGDGDGGSSGSGASAGNVSGFAILAAVTLDGVPENAALGVSLLQGSGGSLALLIAIFASNLPEAVGGAVGMRGSGRSRSFAVVIWTVTALVLALSVVLGSLLLRGAAPEVLSLLLAFAAGAVLASIADTLMPDAYREGGGFVAFATVAGFFVSFVVAHSQ